MNKKANATPKYHGTNWSSIALPVVTMCLAKAPRLLLLRSFSGRCTTDQVHLPRNILPCRSSVTDRDMPQLLCHGPQSRNTLSVHIGLGLAAFLHHNCVGAKIAKLLRHRSSVRSAFHRSRALLYLNFVAEVNLQHKNLRFKVLTLTLLLNFKTYKNNRIRVRFLHLRGGKIDAVNSK